MDTEGQQLISPDDEVFDLAMSHAAEGKYEVAAALYRKLAATGDAAARVNLANLLADRLGEPQAAIEEYRKALSEGRKEAALNLGLLLTELERWAEASEMLDLAVGDGIAGGKRAMGWLMEQQGLYDDARKWYELAVERDPSAWGYLGGLMLDRENTQEAELAFRRGLDAGALENYSYLGALLDQLGRREEAEGTYLQALDEGENNALLGYGNLLSEWPGRGEEAIDIYRLAIERGNRDGHLNLAQQLRSEGRANEAEIEFQHAIDAGDHRAHCEFGHFLAERGRAKESSEQLKLAEAYGYSADGDDE